PRSRLAPYSTLFRSIEGATTSVQYQQDVYSWGKNSVRPVPPEPEEPSLFARGVAAILPGVPDPDVAYREGMARHAAANANNVRVMQQYSGATTDNSNNPAQGLRHHRGRRRTDLHRDAHLERRRRAPCR